MLLLWGPVGAQIKTLELRFDDITQVSLPIHEGFALFQVNPREFRLRTARVERVGSE